jgi:hypothetical protein
MLQKITRLAAGVDGFIIGKNNRKANSRSEALSTMSEWECKAGGRRENILCEPKPTKAYIGAR